MKDYMDRVITVPNILSFIRLCLIPVIIWQYVFLKNYTLAAITVIVSGLTDVIDGFIARKFNMVSHVGRILDPAADKLTQIAVIGCLVYRFRMMIIPLVILIIKELLNGIVALTMLKKAKTTINSRWHGKAATVLLYAMILIHLFWVDITPVVSNIFIFVCIAAMTLSFVLYTVSNAKVISRAEEMKDEALSETAAGITENTEGEAT